jgi:hypothetical protein
MDLTLLSSKLDQLLCHYGTTKGDLAVQNCRAPSLDYRKEESWQTNKACPTCDKDSSVNAEPAVATNAVAVFHYRILTSVSMSRLIISLVRVAPVGYAP